MKRLYVDPPWRVLSAGEIVGTSADFPWETEEGESKADYKKRFELACSNTDSLRDAILIGLSIDPITTDLCLRFQGGLELRSFTVWRDEDNWRFSDYETNERYYVSLAKVEIEPINA